MNGFASFLAGMGGSYLTQKDKLRRQGIEDEDRADRKKLLGMQIEEKQADLDTQQAVRDAGADRVIADGNAGPMPEGQLARMGGTGYASREEAATAAAPMNTPEAKAGRQMSTLMQMDPSKGVALKSAITQAKRQELDLDEGMQKWANLQFDNALNPLASHDEIANLVNDSKGDGMGGAFKVKTLVSPDGSRVSYRRLMPDGSYADRGLDFDNTPEGVTSAKGYLAKNVSIADKLNHMYHSRQLANADREFGARERHWDAEHGLRKEELGLRRDEIGARGPKMSDIDTKEYTGLTRQIEDIYQAMRRAQADGTWDEAAPGTQSLKKDLAALRLRASDIQSRYSKTQNADPLGLRSPAPAGSEGGSASARMVSPQQQAGRDQDRAMILRDELARYKAAGKTQDAASVREELRRMGVDPDEIRPVGHTRPVMGTQAAPAQPVAPASGVRLQPMDIGRSNGIDPERLATMRKVSQSRPAQPPVDITKQVRQQGGQSAIDVEEAKRLARYLR